MRFIPIAAVVFSFLPLPPADQTLPPPKSQMPDLGRPTRPNDEQPLFKFDEYFPGTWKFEWDVPEGVLGPSGTITGTVTYKKVDETFYEAELYRLRGELASSPDQAEADFRRALDVARRQGARALELRAAESLARLTHPR
jgi:hypothetical protein